jgi:hypothetical protein
MALVQLLLETLLYYLACTLLARSREDAPGIIRVFITVFLIALITWGVHGVFGGTFLGRGIASGMWASGVFTFLLSFVILWIGLGIGLIRTILAALLVTLLHHLMNAAFSTTKVADHLNGTI